MKRDSYGVYAVLDSRPPKLLRIIERSSWAWKEASERVCEHVDRLGSRAARLDVQAHLDHKRYEQAVRAYNRYAGAEKLDLPRFSVVAHCGDIPCGQISA